MTSSENNCNFSAKFKQTTTKKFKKPEWRAAMQASSQDFPSNQARAEREFSISRPSRTLPISIEYIHVYLNNLCYLNELYWAHIFY